MSSLVSVMWFFTQYITIQSTEQRNFTTLFQLQWLEVVRVERNGIARTSKDGHGTFQGRLLYSHYPTDSKIRSK